MKVLNAYAGIGGNRHLWPDEWEVTAVELDPRVAAEYARRYPNDTVLVEDAHAFVLERAHEFDAVWTSPPCPTHSRLARNVASRYGRPLEPDPRLWAEVDHLSSMGGLYVVENVHVYYAPPTPPDVVTARHYYWTNNAPALLTEHDTTGIGLPHIWHLPTLEARDMRNAVVPIEGLEIAMAAFTANVEVGGHDARRD